MRVRARFLLTHCKGVSEATASVPYPAAPPRGFRNPRIKPCCVIKYFIGKKKTHRLRKRGVGAPATSGTQPQGKASGLSGHGLRPWWPARPWGPRRAEAGVCLQRPGPRAARDGWGAVKERGVNASGASGAQSSGRRRPSAARANLQPRAGSALGPGFGFKVCVLLCLAPNCSHSR